MATISEDYVSFETAKLLKEKGFDQNCATYYLDGQVWRHYHGEVIPKGKQIYAAPTQAIAMKWLREVHELSLRPRYDEVEDEKERLWYVWFFDILSMNPYKTLVEPEQGYSTYEQACEAAIKYCLEYLI